MSINPDSTVSIYLNNTRYYELHGYRKRNEYYYYQTVHKIMLDTKITGVKSRRQEFHIKKLF